MRLVIDRQRWHRGKGGVSALKMEGADKFCCLGFLALACGYSVDEIEDRATPDGLEKTDRVPKFLLTDDIDSPVCNHLMKVNDDTQMSEAERERLLTVAFAENGVEVIFK